MKDDLLSDLLAKTGHVVAKSRQATNPFCDFGSAFGFIEEQQEIEEELRRFLCMTRIRAARLRHRIEKYEAGETKAELL